MQKSGKCRKISKNSTVMKVYFMTVIKKIATNHIKTYNSPSSSHFRAFLVAQQ